MKTYAFCAIIFSLSIAADCFASKPTYFNPVVVKKILLTNKAKRAAHHSTILRLLEKEFLGTNLEHQELAMLQKFVANNLLEHWDCQKTKNNIVAMTSLLLAMGYNSDEHTEGQCQHCLWVKETLLNCQDQGLVYLELSNQFNPWVVFCAALSAGSVLTLAVFALFFNRSKPLPRKEQSHLNTLPETTLPANPADGATFPAVHPPAPIIETLMVHSSTQAGGQEVQVAQLAQQRDQLETLKKEVEELRAALRICSETFASRIGALEQAGEASGRRLDEKIEGIKTEFDRLNATLDNYGTKITQTEQALREVSSGQEQNAQSVEVIKRDLEECQRKQETFEAALSQRVGQEQHDGLTPRAAQMERETQSQREARPEPPEQFCASPSSMPARLHRMPSVSAQPFRAGAPLRMGPPLDPRASRGPVPPRSAAFVNIAAAPVPKRSQMSRSPSNPRRSLY